MATDGTHPADSTGPNVNEPNANRPGPMGPSAARPDPTRRTLAVEELSEGVLKGDRSLLGRAISLVENQRSDHRRASAELLTRLLSHTGGSHRVGITGVPGVGKSSLLETLGLHLIDQGHRVAVLAVDPSSPVTGGSILGDKTRMTDLATHDAAFVRPSPSAGVLGGVARRTREAILLCEAAGFDVVFVETVGVGQSETVVADMVDTFVLLMLPGAGDQLQGIKRGVLEIADVIAINKADGAQRGLAQSAQREYRAALQLLRGGQAGGAPPVLLCSALERTGIDELWSGIHSHRESLAATNALAARRGQQQVRWLWDLIEADLSAAFRSNPAVASALGDTERAVRAGNLIPRVGAEALLRAFGLGRDASP